jgi:hypothetical protein
MCEPSKETAVSSFLLTSSSGFQSAKQLSKTQYSEVSGIEEILNTYTSLLNRLPFMNQHESTVY